LTGEDLRRARARIGELWALDRPLHCAELGRALEFADGDPGASIRRYEGARTADVPGPVAAGVKMMLGGAIPALGLPAILTPKKRKARAATRRRA
jgi:hypothetical protein